MRTTLPSAPLSVLLSVLLWSAFLVGAQAARAQGAPAAAPLVLDVLTFNAALLPEIAADTDQATRAARMAPHLVGYDVLVLQELFVNRWREALLVELAASYPYQGDLVGVDGARGMPWRQDGGVVVLSRWPIERQASLRFGSVCSGTDCLADKGVAYAAVRVGERLVHVFGTHAQSIYGRDVAAVRAAQFALLRAFVAAQAIPADEPVLIVGDLNVDAHTPELDAMLAALDADWPEVDGEVRFTWDPRANAWAGGRSQHWFDYVLVAADHAQPGLAWNRALPLRDGELDLSDHFAVWGRLVFGE
ncbi:MAG: sphingomyelin phosphodiesterase [Trueperaceae bacterium]|nr:sphingomyelin phosphodiesterase [Trueperaceae bacterium]